MHVVLLVVGGGAVCRQPLVELSSLFSTHNFLWGGTHRSLTRFIFGVGSFLSISSHVFALNKVCSCLILKLCMSPYTQGQPREREHEQDVRLRGRGQGQVHGQHGGALHRGIQLAAPVPLRQQEGARHARGTVCKGMYYVVKVLRGVPGGSWHRHLYVALALFRP